MQDKNIVKNNHSNGYLNDNQTVDNSKALTKFTTGYKDIKLVRYYYQIEEKIIYLWYYYCIFVYKMYSLILLSL